MGCELSKEESSPEDFDNSSNQSSSENENDDQNQSSSHYKISTSNYYSFRPSSYGNYRNSGANAEPRGRAILNKINQQSNLEISSSEEFDNTLNQSTEYLFENNNQNQKNNHHKKNHQKFSDRPSNYKNYRNLKPDTFQRGRAVTLRQMNENNLNVLPKADRNTLNKIIHKKNFDRNPKWDRALDNIQQRLDQKLNLQHAGNNCQ